MIVTLLAAHVLVMAVVVARFRVTIVFEIVVDAVSVCMLNRITAIGPSKK